jgi:hypothetical protein
VGKDIATQVVSRARETPAKLANVLGKRGNDRQRARTGNRLYKITTTAGDCSSFRRPLKQPSPSIL